MTPAEITASMLRADAFTRLLGLNVEASDTGYCRLTFRVTKDMLNGFGVVHGGVLFSAADSAFAFACNSNGTVTLALEASIHFTQSCREGDVLTVEAREVHAGNRIGVFDVRTRNQAGELVSLFKGTAYKTSTPHV